MKVSNQFSSKGKKEVGSNKLEACCVGHTLDFGILVPPKSSDPMAPLVRISYAEYLNQYSNGQKPPWLNDCHLENNSALKCKSLPPGPHGFSTKHSDKHQLIEKFKVQKYIVDEDILPALYQFSAKAPNANDILSLASHILSHEPSKAEERFGLESIVWAAFSAKPSSELENTREYLVGRGFHLSALYEAFYFLESLDPNTRTLDTLVANYQLFAGLQSFEIPPEVVDQLIDKASDGRVSAIGNYSYEFNAIPSFNGISSRQVWEKLSSSSTPTQLTHRPAAPFTACLYYGTHSQGFEPQDIVSFYAASKSTLFANQAMPPLPISSGNSLDWQPRGLLGVQLDVLRFSVLEYLAKEYGFTRLGLLSSSNIKRVAKTDPKYGMLSNRAKINEGNALSAGFMYSQLDGNLYLELI